LILTSADIISRCKVNPPLITNFQEKNLEGGACDLRLSEVWRSDQEHCFIGEHTRRTARKKKLSLEGSIKGNSSYHLSQMVFYHLKTIEEVNVPTNLRGHISPRVTWGDCGAILLVSHVAAGYNGQLKFGLLCTMPITIELGARIASIEFSLMNDQETLAYNGPRQGGVMLGEKKVRAY